MRKYVALSLTVWFMGAAAHGWTLDESPAQPGEWGYRPADNAEAALNPPGFSWRPDRDAVRYILQIARDADFEDIVYEVTDTPWSAHCPAMALPPGGLHWRYAGINETGDQSDWSAVRRFRTPEDAPHFPQPALAELIARVPETHPRLFFRPEELPRIQLQAKGALAERWEALVAEADKLIEAPPDTSEPPLYPEGTEYKSGEWRRIWWGNRLRALAVADGAATLAFVYRVSGEAKYGEAARALLVALTEWDPEGSTQYRYNDEAAMPLLKYPARAYTWVHDLLDRDERDAVREMMRIRGQQCFEHLRRGNHLWRPYRSHNNRAWHFLGEVAIAFLGDFPEAEEWLEFSMTVFHTAYPVWGAEDGGWHEGIAYWNSYLLRFMTWTRIVKSAFNIDTFAMPFFNATGDYGMYMLPPGTKAGAFADLAPNSGSQRIATLMAILAAGARNPYWQWHAEAHGAGVGGGYLGFLYALGAAGLEARSPENLPSSKAFRDVGLAVLNTSLTDGEKNVQIHFKSSPFGRQSHGYNANNAFILHVHGEPVFISSGRRDVHGSPHHTMWMWETKSDNAILVNGAGQKKHTAGAVGRITHFETSNWLDIVEGEAGEAYEDRLDRWTRRIFFFKPHVAVIHDVLEAPEPSTYQWLLHAPGAFDIGGDQRVYWRGGNAAASVRFLHPKGLAISQDNEFDPPPADWVTWELDHWHLTAEAQEAAKQQEFVTLLVVAGEHPEAVLEEENGRRLLTLASSALGTVTLALEPDRYAIERLALPGETPADDRENNGENSDGDD